MFEAIPYPASRSSTHDSENVLIWNVGLPLLGSLDKKFDRLLLGRLNVMVPSPEDERAAVFCDYNAHFLLEQFTYCL